MLWIFVVAFLVSTSINSCESAQNLTAIKWESNVNTAEKLKAAFESSKSADFLQII